MARSVWLTFRDGLAPQEAGVSVSVFFYVKKVGGQERRPTKSQSENRKQKGISHMDFLQRALHDTEHRLYFHGKTATEAQMLRCEDPDWAKRSRSSPRKCKGISFPQTPDRSRRAGSQ